MVLDWRLQRGCRLPYQMRMEERESALSAQQRHSYRALSREETHLSITNASGCLRVSQNNIGRSAICTTPLVEACATDVPHVKCKRGSPPQTHIVQAHIGLSDDVQIYIVMIQETKTLRNIVLKEDLPSYLLLKLFYATSHLLSVLKSSPHFKSTRALLSQMGDKRETKTCREAYWLR